MRSAKQRISSALILAVGASMLMGCELPERNTQVKSIKIGVTLYDQYDAFLSELMEDFNTYAAAKEEETGIAINVEVYNASQSQTTQNNQVEAMAQDGCDIICVNLVDRTDPTTVIDLAEKNDIPVIFFNSQYNRISVRIIWNICQLRQFDNRSFQTIHYFSRSIFRT